MSVVTFNSDQFDWSYYEHNNSWIAKSITKLSTGGAQTIAIVSSETGVTRVFNFDAEFTELLSYSLIYNNRKRKFRGDPKITIQIINHE